MRAKKPRYVMICGKNREFFRAKKEITEKYGFTYLQINHALLGFPLSRGGNVYWMYYYTCKFCEDYMIESKNCHVCEKIKIESNRLLKGERINAYLFKR